MLDANEAWAPGHTRVRGARVRSVQNGDNDSEIDPCFPLTSRRSIDCTVRARSHQ